MRARKMIAAGMLVVGLGAACGGTETNRYGAEVPKGCTEINDQYTALVLKAAASNLEEGMTLEEMEANNAALELKADAVIQQHPQCFDDEVEERA